MFPVDPTDPTPLYVQLERAIRVAIATGRLHAGERLPTVRQLAVDLRINANTVSKVYGALERAGVLDTQRGVGTFVRQRVDRSASRAERESQLARLVDRFLGDVIELGFSGDEAVILLRNRWAAHKQENSRG